MFKKIWTDPVWSKVISVAIVGLATFVYALLKSKADNVSLKTVFDDLLQMQVKVIYVLGALILFLIVRRLFKKKPKAKSYYSAKQQQLREFNKITDNESGILFRWGVYFEYDKPFIADLEAYCTKHEGAPIRFVGNSCPMYNCENHQKDINYHLVKNHIESMLIDSWDKMK
jgi:hypothetical protein